MKQYSNRGFAKFMYTYLHPFTENNLPSRIMRRKAMYVSRKIRARSAVSIT